MPYKDSLGVSSFLRGNFAALEDFIVAVLGPVPNVSLAEVRPRRGLAGLDLRSRIDSFARSKYGNLLFRPCCSAAGLMALHRGGPRGAGFVTLFNFKGLLA